VLVLAGGESLWHPIPSNSVGAIQLWHLVDFSAHALESFERGIHRDHLI
jgi:hypothetical protein